MVIAARASGKKTEAVSVDGSKRLSFKFAIISAGNLVASNDPESFAINPEYPPELQPRDRSRAANRVQVQNMAANLSPDALITDFKSLDRGAPIVGDDSVVESGNGRAMAILRAISQHPGQYAEYEAALKVRAPEFGMTAEQVAQVDNPVLVRVRTFKTDRVEFARQANQAGVIGQSATEDARTDAKRIPAVTLEGLQIGDDQGIEEALRARKNIGFVTEFLKVVPENERASLVDAAGALNQTGIRRVTLAVFTKAYPGETGLRLGERFFESTDPAVRNVFNGMTRSLAAVARPKHSHRTASGIRRLLSRRISPRPCRRSPPSRHRAGRLTIIWPNNNYSTGILARFKKRS